MMMGHFTKDFRANYEEVMSLFTMGHNEVSINT
jgi:hypothetical protein